jgi:hypothetical protein
LTDSSSQPAACLTEQNAGRLKARESRSIYLERIRASLCLRNRTIILASFYHQASNYLFFSKNLFFLFSWLFKNQMPGFRLRTLKQLDDTEGTVRLHDGKEVLNYFDLGELLMFLKQEVRVIASVTMIWCSSHPSLQIPMIPCDGQHGENGLPLAACAYWPSSPMLPWPVSIQPSWTYQSNSPLHMLK